MAKKSGAADEEMFLNAFEDVPRVQIYSAKELEQELTRIRDVCSDASVDWEKRIDSLKRLRSLLMAGASEFKELYAFLKPLELSFQISIKDLRSQVVREACFTIAYVASCIGLKGDRLAEALLPTLINLIQNSAKIMSSCAVVAIRFIIQYIRASRLVPIITYNISSKSREIRKACCEFLDQLLHTWPTHALEKHVGILQEAIKKGISDADAEARASSRKAFWGFADKFKQEAEFLLNSLDVNKQRMLHGEQTAVMSNSNSLNSMYQGTRRAQPIKSGYSNGSVENLARPSSSLAKKSRTPTFSQKNDSTAANRSQIPVSPFRTTSAIDPGAQRRAKARAGFGPLPQHRIISSGYSLPRTNPRKFDSNLSTVSTQPSPSPSIERSRSKTRVSQSQPGSRSSSPSSRYNYITSFQADGRFYCVRRKSGIPLSTSKREAGSFDEAENLNPEDIYNLLKKTTDEIQNYSLNSSRRPSSPTLIPTSPSRITTINRSLKETSCASQDSGISQIDGVSTYSRSIPNSSPSKPIGSPSFQNGCNSFMNNEFSAKFNCVIISLKNNSQDVDARKEVLNDLIELVREASSSDWSKHFKDIYRILLDKISTDPNSALRALALRTLCDLLVKQTQLFQDFIELTILRLLEASKDTEKEVIRASEVAAATAATVLPSEQCLKVLKSVIMTGGNPVNIAAIKMLTKLIEQQPKQKLIDLLPDMIPALIHAYDDTESAVRKAAVFCMVAIHCVVGDEMKPYLSSLNGSKMKLLKLYIERAKTQSGGSSPVSSTPNNNSS